MVYLGSFGWLGAICTQRTACSWLSPFAAFTRSCLRNLLAENGSGGVRLLRSMEEVVQAYEDISGMDGLVRGGDSGPDRRSVPRS